MLSKSPSLIIIIFLISSCGNETTTSSNVGENNTSTSFEETCISYGKNTQRCNFIHDGLEDAVVPYAGIDALGMEPIDDVLTFWADVNNCNPVRVIAVVDSFNSNDSADYINYESCENDVDVKLIRIPSMGHTWPDLNNFNISATEEIWNFLSQYDLNGKIAN